MEKKKVEEKMLDVMVLPGSVALPHVITKKGNVYRFEPVCSVPTSYANALVKGNAKVYGLYNGEKIDLAKYSIKDGFAGLTVEKLFEKLSEEDKAEVLALIKEKLNPKKVVAPENEVFNAKKAKDEQLRMWLKGKGVKIPEQATERKHLIGLVQRRQMFEEMGADELRVFAKENEVELPENTVEREYHVDELVVLLEEQLDLVK